MGGNGSFKGVFQSRGGALRRDELQHLTNPTHIILIFAYNRTGKTRLSMDFKNVGKTAMTSPLRTESGERITTEDGANIEVEAVQRDTLYFNAYTEDLFTYLNDWFLASVDADVATPTGQPDANDLMAYFNSRVRIS